MTTKDPRHGVGTTTAVVFSIVALAVATIGVGVSLGVDDDSTASASSAEAAEPVASVQELPAEPVTIPEVSRHPSDLPPSADYTRYDDGEYADVVERDGPITQEIHFDVLEGVTEVVPGTTLDVWTFDGTVPGPMIRARVGDTLDFFLHNPGGSELPHNVDFHAVTGPGGGATSLDTAPGATSELRVQLRAPGVYVYHCAFPDVPTHLAHGMYGLVVVEPEGGLPEVDHEYYVMQHEWYTTRGGTEGVTQLAQAGHLEYSGAHANLEEPTFVQFNGRPDSLTGDRALGVFDEPIATGDTVRMYVGNIGPNLLSSFHVIGEIFDRVYVEGSFDLVNRNVQSTVVPAGGATAVELTVEVPGDYVLVDHALFRIHKGALGLLHAEGTERPEIYEPITSSDVRGEGDAGGH